MYTYQKEEKFFTIENNVGTKIYVNKYGDIHSVNFGDIQLNHLEANNYEKSLANLYIKIFTKESIICEPIKKFTQHIDISKTNYSINYERTIENLHVSYRIVLQENDHIVFSTISVHNNSDDTIEYSLTYGQDLGLASASMLKINACYACQYIDHKIFTDEDFGYIICSRQNLTQNGHNPFVQTGALEKICGFSTDGFQFFGKEYKLLHNPKISHEKHLENKNYQYEFAYIALETEKKTLSSKETKHTSFYNYMVETIKEENVSRPFSVKTIQQVPQQEDKSEKSVLAPHKNPFVFKRGIFQEPTLSEIQAMYPLRKHEEYHNDTLISFFAEQGVYVTLPHKESLLERPTGHIIFSGNELLENKNILSSTHYIFGIFNSQLALGNSSFNQFIGINRNFLNLQSFSGQRIFIKEEGEFIQLSIPSIYEQGYNYSKWVYYREDEHIEVYSYASATSPVISLEIISSIPREFYISHNVIMGNNENESNITVNRDGNILTVTGDNERILAKYDNLHYIIHVQNSFDVIDTSGEPYLILKIEDTHIKLHMTGSTSQLVQSEIQSVLPKTFQEERSKYITFLTHVTNNFSLVSQSAEEKKISTIFLWYIHNALTHYLVSHGLEQYFGAAWGTRDILQGSLELFISLRKYKICANILKKVYSHQYIETGNWPQYFMPDAYYHIQNVDSHGDIIVWPLKTIAEYIISSDDVDFLEEFVPYTAKKNLEYTTTKEKIIDHIKKQIAYIKENRLDGTYLFSYGDGDWDDTLQPKNESLKKNMVSTWTMALLLQSLNQLSFVFEKYKVHLDFNEEIKDLKKMLETDFFTYAVQHDVISGFLVKENGDIKPLLHPADTTTHIKYRLLPMMRGIISEVFSKDMADKHYNIIKKHLLFPDGVRLMTEPITYNGGRQTYFQRAELASNVGREIGLQYCHAHIRFIELLCKLGKGTEAIDNIVKIIPVNIQESVSNADFRQSNAYFSSSDAHFYDRYDFKNYFDKLKDQKVKVKGGWRIYSSGPGIFIHQIISNFFGIRYEGNYVIFDPVVSMKIPEYCISYSLFDIPINITIIPQKQEHTPKKILINDTQLSFDLTKNPYRSGGAILEKEKCMPLIVEEYKNNIKIYL